MQRKTTVLLLSLLAGCFAQGLFALDKTPEISIRWRMDVIKEETNDKEVIAGKDQELKFTLPYIRLAVTGKIDKRMSYQVRFRLNRTLEKESPSKDETGPGLDYAYVDRVMGNRLKLRVGKQKFFHGGFDGAVSSRDEYSFVAGYQSIYAVGVGAFYEQDGHHFLFQALNNRNDLDNQQAPLYGVCWSTSFLGGLLNPIVNYHIDPFENNGAEVTVKGVKSLLAVGHRLRVKDKILFDVDYLLNKSEETISGGRKSKNYGFAARFIYKIGFWSPQIKYSTIKKESLNTAAPAGDEKNYHMALEYYPRRETRFRYHLAYIVQDDRPAAGAQVRKSFIKLGLAGSF